ncbi:hypothetical protein [Mesorhizobium sp. M0208]|uniref:hypothetical protein n=1 Tax=Mesorhizobium sp. M0208 TaxID=2956916 RepID=UPI00333C0296
MGINLDIPGIWTYRSFLNVPGNVGDFGKLTVWEAELSLEVSEDGHIYGLLGERPDLCVGTEPYLLVEGTVIPGNPAVISWRAKGKPQSEYDGWIYDYRGYLSPEWPDAPRNRPTIVGTVTRTVAHNGAPAGSVFSFVAVKSDFLEPRKTIPLAKSIIDMMSSAEHRYHHALWHASRDTWDNLSDPKKEALRATGWQPGPKTKERASLAADRLANGSGEDFFYMHRRMVKEVRAMDPSVGTWRRLPQQQFPSSFAPETKASQIGNLDGYSLPPAWVVPGDPDTTNWLFELRKTSTLYGRFQAWEALYTSADYLASLSLGELGSRIEFTIHNWMHMRWTSVTRDPTGDVARRGLPLPNGRDALDFDEKWLDPEYDYLGETFSSHINPIFWRLHGWVDDRINDWYRAHEAVRPGVVKPMTLDGVEWFAVDGTWVKNDEPWEGARASSSPTHHAGHNHPGHSGRVLDVPTMQAALRIIYGPEPDAAPSAMEDHGQALPGTRASWFKNVPA